MSVCVETDTETETETDRQRQRQTDRDRDRQRERERERERERDRDRDRDRQRVRGHTQRGEHALYQAKVVMKATHKCGPGVDGDGSALFRVSKDSGFLIVRNLRPSTTSPELLLGLAMALA